MNIHFICRGNILRSLIAETYLKSLGLRDVNVISSGTNVNREDETERKYFSDTLNLLNNHGIKDHAKDSPEQLTQSRADNKDVTVCMNQRVIDEALTIATLPDNTINWSIVDIGEGHRIVEEDKGLYLEEIYKEITQGVDELVKIHNLR